MKNSRQVFETLSGLFSPNLIHQSSCSILITHAKIRPILYDDWSIRLRENRPDWALKHLAAILRHIELNKRTGRPKVSLGEGNNDRGASLHYIKAHVLWSKTS